LKDGSVVESGDKRRLIEKPVERYTQSLWAVRNLACAPQPPVSSTAKPVLSVKNIEAGYGRKNVIEGISFDLYRGRTLAVVGESGSGKSTLGRCITGLLPIKNGVITYNDVALASSFKKRSRDQLKSIQMIYQMADTALNPRHGIGDIVARPLRFYSDLKGARLHARTREILDAVGLEPDAFFSRLPHELSGGQKQRVGIARALAADPAVIICDEITSALDQLVAEGILRLIDDLKNTLGLSYLFITHDLTVVQSIADDVLVLKAGNVVEYGERGHVFTPPCDKYVTQLVNSMPQMNPDWLDDLVRCGSAQSQA
jgi:peptide/nickel transport system ATP-binding protein